MENQKNTTKTYLNVIGVSIARPLFGGNDRNHVGADSISAQDYRGISNTHGITLIALAISRKCVRYEERA